MTSLEDRDTLPPPPEEVEALSFADKVLQQLDRIELALGTLTDEVLRLRKRDEDRGEQVEFMERRMKSFTPAAGMPAQRNGGEP